MINTETTKDAILKAIIDCADKQLGHDARHFADAYSALVNAEVQVQMTEYALTHCPECQKHLDDGEFPQEIG